MSNQINVIYPYFHKGFWVFDDESKNLDKEPFVGNMDVLIENALVLLKVKNPQKGFAAIFSGDSFPEAKIVLDWVKNECGGNVYRWEGVEGWLCPALLKYFYNAPKKIYINLKTLEF